MSRFFGALLAALAGVAAVTLVARAGEANATTAGFAYLLVVLGIAAWRGFLAGALASVAATLAYNFNFLPPVGRFEIADPQNWVSLGAFLIAALVASRLLTQAREREALNAQRARLEALQARDELRTALLRAVSHDLSTPLTAILLHVESLRRSSASDPAAARVVEQLAEQAGGLKRRIENLLAMARIEAGTLVPRREPTPAADLFRAVRESLPLVTASRAIETRVATDCPDLDVDPTLILEVLVNLVENAHRAAPAGTTLELRAEQSRAFAGRVLLEVLDRGPGPAVETPRDGGDTGRRGLGLEIARSLAAACGGSVALQPRDGGGARAVVDLPAAAIGDAVEAPAR